MLRPIKSVLGFKIKAEDAEIGHIVDFYFDDEYLVMRYLVVETGGWLSGKKVLIAKSAFLGQPDWGERQFPVALSKSMVEKCPDVDTDKPISRQKEEELSAHYQWPMYWEAGSSTMLMPAIPQAPLLFPPKKNRKFDSHLRSLKEVLGYRIHAADGDIGHVDDFIVDDEKWNIGFLAADVGSWLSGRKVLIALQWIGKMSWDERSVHIELSKKEIEESPHYEPKELIGEDYIKRLHEHYRHSRKTV